VVKPHTPPAIVLKLSPPATALGLVLDTVSPVPSWPNELSPQQYADPPGAMPHVCCVPAERDVNVRPPVTGTGIVTPALDT
jgi:hypothetical protein